MSVIEFENVSNARDLGGIGLGDGRVVVPERFFRGGALNKANNHDVALLRDELGIDLTIDLRTGWERAAKPNVAMPGVEDVHVPFYDNDIVGIEYVKPIPGSKMVGRDFACDPNDFYASMPNPLTAKQMAQALHLVFDRAVAGKPTYYHCSGGKDRAGILSVLLLNILGADRDAILEDYLLTNVARDKNFDSIYARFLRLCETEELALATTNAHRALPENLVAFYDAVDAHYGSMDAFIRDTLGFSDAEIALLRERFSCEP